MPEGREREFSGYINGENVKGYFNKKVSDEKWQYTERILKIIIMIVRAGVFK